MSVVLRLTEQLREHAGVASRRVVVPWDAAAPARPVGELAAGLPKPSRWHPGATSEVYRRRVERLLEHQGWEHLERARAGGRGGPGRQDAGHAGTAGHHRGGRARACL